MKRKLALLMGAILLLGACAGAGADSHLSDEVSCDAVQTELTKAEKDLDEAKSDAENSEGTPDEEAANDAVDEAQTKVEELRKRKEECRKEATTTTKEKETRPSTTSTTVAAPTADDIANQVPEVFDGFEPEDIAVGSDSVVFEGAAEERGTAAFSQRTLKTPEEVGKFLNEDTDVSRAAKQRVIDAINRRGWEKLAALLQAHPKASKKEKEQFAAQIRKDNKEETKRALSGEGYFPVQVKVAARVLGTTYFKDGQVLESGEWRSVGPNDVFWLFLGRDGKILFDAAIRADCGNPNLRLVTPIPPGEKPPTPIDKLCPRDGEVPDDNGLCPKDPEEDPLANPDIPRQPTVPGRTPVGTPIEPITTPVTTPTGCNGPCPNPVTTTTTRPTGTTTTTLPPSTTPVTGPPPTTLPPPPPLD
jgi:hypothetical protein